MEENKRDTDSESIYINLEDIETASRSEIYENCPNTATPKPGSEAASSRGQVCFGSPAAVCLGLLCVLLLAVITGLSIKYNKEREQLWSNYANITKERDQLQSSYNDLFMQREELQACFDNLTMERDGVQCKLSNIEIFCPHGWRKFMPSCYYVSTLEKTWDQSRQDCRDRGADLVIVNSSEEQTFVSGLARNFWIGLTHNYHVRNWKWVDSTLLKFGYWMSGESNNHPVLGSELYKQKICVQAATGGYDPLFSWRSRPCENRYTWICEKRIQCLIK